MTCLGMGLSQFIQFTIMHSFCFIFFLHAENLSHCFFPNMLCPLFFSCNIYILTYVDISVCILSIFITSLSFFPSLYLSLIFWGPLFSLLVVDTIGGLPNSQSTFFLLTLFVWQCAQTQAMVHHWLIWGNQESPNDNEQRIIRWL